MSIKVKPGRWQQRDGGTAVVRSVKPLDPWPWKGTDSTNEANSWQNNGHCLTPNHPHDTDLVEYLGPEEQTGGEEMSIEVKPGQWRERGGGIATVEERLHPTNSFQWFGRDSLNLPSLWDNDGSWLRPGLQHQHDLVEYLGPAER